MIIKGTTKIGMIVVRNHVIARVMKGSQLIWEYIISCIAKGYWINTVGWRNDKYWKNNKSSYNG